MAEAMITKLRQGASLGTLALFGVLVAAGPAAAGPRVAVSRGIREVHTAEPRTVILLGSGWQFKLGDDTSTALAAASGGGWQTVSVPHSWNRVGYYQPDPERHINHAKDINKTLGIGWYQLEFTPPALGQGKRAWLQFDAASRTAEVWLNGTRLGQHRGGFSRFRFDATEALRAGRPNLLVVKVDNSEPKLGGSTADTLPLLGDFFVRGGLYRPVSLIVTDQVHFDLLDYGGPGVYATTTALNGRQASISVRSRLRNDSDQPTTVRLTTKLIDAVGASVAQQETRIALPAHSDGVNDHRIEVARARLWQGVSDPYLYRLRTEIRSVSGRLLDAVDQPFGIRQIKLDPSQGLLLNGRHVPLHGVGMHQDQEGKDWALQPEDVAKSVDILREMGANTIRLTHYQHGQPIHDLADKTGLILWDEIPLVTAWTLSASQKDAPSALVADARQQLAELIRQNMNHASVVAWGIANEVDFGASRPDFLGKAPANVPDPVPLLRELAALSKATDPSRPTVLANCCEDRQADSPIVATAVDAFGINRYFGWYYGKVDDVGVHLDALHSKRPQQPMAVTEYGAGAATTIHSDDPSGGPIDPGGADQPEEYQSWLHERTWHALEARPYLWANWLWVGFDFASTVRHEGDAVDINTKGLVTYDRAIRKDAYYFYKANWSNAPTVHINGSRYVNRAYSVTDVRVYSNAASTRLDANGVSLGSRSNCPDHVCVWRAVRLQAGSNRLSAIGSFPAGPVRDDVEWTLSPDAAQSFRIDSGAVVARAPGFGSDAFFIGGTAGTTDERGGRGRAAVPAVITGSLNRNIAASFREGDFHYKIPVPAGRYRVTLSFVEPKTSTAPHVFDVVTEGRTVVDHLDLAAEGVLRAVTRSFDVSITGAGLDMHFRPSKGAKALVSAIEVVPSL